MRHFIGSIVSRKTAVAAALAACVLTAAGVALAEEFSSQYTSTAQRNCKKVKASKAVGAPGPACHVAYVDGRANAEPNVLARQAADENARTFDCANKPLVVGERGRAIELALP